MKVIKYPAKEEWSEIVKRPHLDVSQLNATSPIITLPHSIIARSLKV